MTASRGVSSVRLFHFVSSVLCSFRRSPFPPPPPAAFPVPCHLPPLSGPPPPFPPCAPALRVECTVLLVALRWFALPFFRNAAPPQGRQFGSVPVSQWLCAVGSWVLSSVSVGLVSVVVHLAWFVGRCHTFVPMVMSCFVLHFT